MKESKRLHQAVVVILSIFLCLSMMLVASWVQAAPFLVCNPTSEDVTKYEIEVNGVVEPATLEELTTGVRIHHDLNNWSENSYTVRARAGNIWGWSEWSVPLEFAKAIPTVLSVSGLGIEE